MFSNSPKGSFSEKKKSLTDHKSATDKTKTSDRQQVIDQQTQTVIGLGGKPKVQDDFRGLLLEFVISCLLDQPSDVINYAATYFQSLEEHRHTLMIRDYEDKAESIHSENQSSAESSKESLEEVKQDDDNGEIEAEMVEKSVDTLPNYYDRAKSIQPFG